MATSGAISLSKVELLTGYNYYIWEMKVSAILRSRKLFKLVIEEPEPENGEVGSDQAEKWALWESANDEAFGIIVVTLSAEQAGLFIGQRNAKHVWDELKRIHAGNAEDKRIDTVLEFKNLKMGGNETVDSYINRARNIATKCSALGQVIPLREQVYHIVRGLHSRFESVAAVLRPQRSATLEDVQQSLREEEIRTHPSSAQNSQHLEKAYRVRDGRGGGKYHNNNNNCFICGKPGHKAKSCWHRPNNGESKRSESTNFKNFRKPGGNNFKGKRNGENCANSANNCALNASVDGVVEIQDKFWTLDSGCTTHMSPRKDWMSDVRQVKNDIHLAEDGRSILAEAIGDIKLSTMIGNGETKNIIIKDVLYVPKLRTNLLSVKSMTSKGNRVIFEKESAKILNESGETIAEANEQNRLYILETQLQKGEQISECLIAGMSNADTKVNTDKELWHKRLGHLNDEYMERLMQKNMVRGLNFQSQKLGICESCVMGKLTQDPFREIDQETSKKPLDLIHMDLCGPMPKKSIGGARYMYVIVDSYTRRIFVSFLKTKDETFKSFLEFKNRYENELDAKIKNVRSDNGTEFVNKEFENLFRTEGINHQRTVPYSPQSNGVAERANRTILDKARTMLIDAGLPVDYWAEAVSTATYLRNRTPTKTGGCKTPMEIWSGNIPTVSHLKIFGCMTYYYIPKTKQEKFAPKAKRGIFLGYSQKRKAYRIYNPSEQIVHEVKTAKFDEDRKGAILLCDKGTQDIQAEQLQYQTEDSEEYEDEYIPENPQVDLTDREHENEQEIINYDREEIQPPRTRGRKLGDTNELLQIRQRIQALEREERLLAQGVKRSQRIKDQHLVGTTINNENQTPNSYAEAQNSHYSEQWRQAMEEELNSLKNHDVWKLVERTPDMKVIKSKWIYNTKENPDGTIDRRKARLVAVGCGQRPGLDYDVSYSPVMRLESLRTLIAIAAQKGYKIKQYDVKTAYLHGNLKEKVFMEQPEGFEEEVNRDKVCKLNKSLYGLPQSGRNWNEKLNDVLTRIGFQKLESDCCVYQMKTEKGIILMGVYVDDIIVTGNNEKQMDEIMNKLNAQFKMTEGSKIILFLGINISETEDGFELSQRKYVEKILEKYRLSECKPVKTPGDPNQNTDESQDSESVDVTEYQEMIGSLMYLATGTRPDISFQVSQLSQYCKNPKRIHMTALKRVYRYLQGTREYKLVYKRNEGNLTIHTDASWNSTQDAKSISGYTTKMGDSLISWKSAKQPLVALSTCEAEMMSICEGVREIKWIVGLLTELDMRHCVKLPLTVMTDSKAAIDWIKSENHHPRTKHINRKFFFIRDEVKKGNIGLRFVPSEEMEADALTKNLSAERLSASNQRWGLLNRSGK